MQFEKYTSCECGEDLRKRLSHYKELGTSEIHMTMIGSDSGPEDGLSGTKLHIRLHQPEIVGSRVEFRFDTSHIFSLFRNNKFWFEYPGLEPEDFLMDDLST